eukprot:5398972-Pleurochrysis_carterae.AAC.2
MPRRSWNSNWFCSAVRSVIAPSSLRHVTRATESAPNSPAGKSTRATYPAPRSILSGAPSSVCP